MDDIIKTGIQYVADDIKKQLIGNAKYLMDSAINFIKKLENIAQNYEHLTGIMRLGGDNSSLSRIRQAMKQSQDRLKEAVEAQYIFEEQVNNFLGRQIHLAWVDVETGEMYLIEETAAREIYTLVSTGKTGMSGNIKIKDMDSFKNKMSSLPSFVQEQYRDLVNKRVMNHQGLIRTIMSRLDDNLNKDNFWYKKYPSTVYWQHPPQGASNEGKWSWSIPTKKGFISQGYIRLVFNSIENLGQINEYNIGHFMMGFVESNDNIPGIVKGDIIVKNTDNTVQIAVKSNKLFSTASIGPYITTAYQIIQFYNKLEELNIEKVEGFLENLQVYNKKIFETSQEKAKDNLEKIFKQSGAIVT